MTKVGCWSVLSLEIRLIIAHYQEGALHLRHQVKNFLCKLEVVTQRWQQAMVDLQQAASHIAGTFRHLPVLPISSPSNLLKCAYSATSQVCRLVPQQLCETWNYYQSHCTVGE